MTDVRELVPEFFFLPELFLNKEKHDFGHQQTEERVNNVNLPTWCFNDPYIFVARHRQALESDHVSRNIHNWIDLIFGYKQRGEEAVKNLNLYYYLTYEDSVDLSTILDEKEKLSIESQIIHFGQCPIQLFQTPHPIRLPKKDINYLKLVGDKEAKLQYFTLIPHTYSP